MAGVEFEPCGCPRCEGRRIEHPPAAPGCPCPECQPGPGLASVRQAQLEAVLGPVTKVITRDYCMICSAIVTVTATRNGPSWINECQNHHVWHSFD